MFTYDNCNNVAEATKKTFCGELHNANHKSFFQQYFVWGTVSQSTKRQDTLEISGGMAPWLSL